jgi:broad specificity phosphatase PhoE
MRRVRATMKTVHFLRHGQAMHNPRAEAARADGCDFDTFLRLMKEDDAFDADLTPVGRSQAETAARLGSKTSTVQLVVSSPLSRALDTAKLVLPDATQAGRRFVACDNLRERSGWFLNARRRPRTEQAARYPACDFSLLESEDDELWLGCADELERTSNVAERGYRLLQWLAEREEEEIAVVAHGGLFHYLLNEHPKVQAADAAAAARFGNCELRTFTLSWTEGGAEGRDFVVACAVGDGDALPSFVESNFTTKVAYEAWRKQVA